MKIWIQSCSGEADAATWSVYQDSVRRHARTCVRPETEVAFHGVRATFPGIDHLETAQHLATFDVLRNAWTPSARATTPSS